MGRLKQLLIILIGLLSVTSCEEKNTEGNDNVENTEKRIISLSGTITESVFALGHGKNIVGVDVTSTYPHEINKLPKLGHTSSIKAEGLISLQPTHVLFEEGSVNQTVLDQLNTAGISTTGLNREFSVEGTKQLMHDIANVFNDSVPTDLLQALDSYSTQLKLLEDQPKVLFIYGRGAGNLMVAGENTSIEKIIELAGGKNAVSGFQDFKPLSNEVLIEANPDYILLFESAKSSLNGLEGILAIPGVANTRAGKEQKIIYMDGQLLSGFGPRLNEAIIELNRAISK